MKSPEFRKMTGFIKRKPTLESDSRRDSEQDPYHYPQYRPSPAFANPYNRVPQSRPPHFSPAPPYQYYDQNTDRSSEFDKFELTSSLKARHNMVPPSISNNRSHIPAYMRHNHHINPHEYTESQQSLGESSFSLSPYRHHDEDSRTSSDSEEFEKFDPRPAARQVKYLEHRQPIHEESEQSGVSMQNIAAYDNSRGQPKRNVNQYARHNEQIKHKDDHRDDRKYQKQNNNNRQSRQSSDEWSDEQRNREQQYKKFAMPPAPAVRPTSSSKDRLPPKHPQYNNFLPKQQTKLSLEKRQYPEAPAYPKPILKQGKSTAQKTQTNTYQKPKHHLVESIPKRVGHGRGSQNSDQDNFSSSLDSSSSRENSARKDSRKKVHNQEYQYVSFSSKMQQQPEFVKKSRSEEPQPEEERSGSESDEEFEYTPEAEEEHRIAESRYRKLQNARQSSNHKVEGSKASQNRHALSRSHERLHHTQMQNANQQESSEQELITEYDTKLFNGGNAKARFLDNKRQQLERQRQQQQQRYYPGAQDSHTHKHHTKHDSHQKHQQKSVNSQDRRHQYESYSEEDAPAQKPIHHNIKFEIDVKAKNLSLAEAFELKCGRLKQKLEQEREEFKKGNRTQMQQEQMQRDNVTYQVENDRRMANTRSERQSLERPSTSVNKKAERLAMGIKPQVTKKEMYHMTMKNYKQLPEVRNRINQEKKKQDLVRRMLNVKKLDREVRLRMKYGNRR